MTTKLATTLMLEISNPRESTFNELETDNSDKTFNARVVFYNTLKSLDVMAEISAVNFLDNLSVSTELVKFLSLNTSVDAVDKLVARSSAVDSQLSTLHKDVAGSLKTVSTIGNKQESLIAQVKDLAKQLKKVAGTST